MYYSTDNGELDDGRDDPDGCRRRVRRQHPRPAVTHADQALPCGDRQRFEYGHPGRAGLRVPVRHHAFGRLPGDPGRRFEYARADLCRRVYRDRQDLRHVELGQPGNADARDAERLRGGDRGRELVLRRPLALLPVLDQNDGSKQRIAFWEGYVTDRARREPSWRSTPAWPT